MPVKFLLAGIPSHLLKAIVGKVTIGEFIRLMRTCKVFFELCSSFENAISLSNRCSFSIQRKYVSTCIRTSYCAQKGKYLEVVSYANWIGNLKYFRHNYLLIQLSHIHGQAVLSYLVEIARKLRIRTENIRITNVANSSPEKVKELTEFIEVLQPQKMILIPRYNSIQTFPTSLYNGIKRISLGPIDYGNSELLQLQQEYIKIYAREVTSTGINRFLREWFFGQRSIKSVTIRTEQDISVQEILSTLPGVSLMYDSVSHDDSLLSPLDQTVLAETGEDGGVSLCESSFYILIKSENVLEQFLLLIGSKIVKIVELSRPIHALFYYLSEEHFSTITGEKKPNICEFCYEIDGEAHNCFNGFS